jgi:hypothetical protein
MNWITFYQGKTDQIYFITSKNQERDFMKYYEFLTYINSEYKIIDFFEFKNAIDKFKVIILYEDNTWEIIPENIQEASYEELLAINNQDQEEKSPFEKYVDKQKVKLSQMFDFRKKELSGRYKK